MCSVQMKHSSMRQLHRPRLPRCDFTLTVIDYIAGGWTMVSSSFIFLYLFSFNFRFNMLNLLLLSEQIMMSCGVYAVCHFKCICHGRQKSYKKKQCWCKKSKGETKRRNKKPLLESFVHESDYSMISIL